jgi:hypothetical protein
LNLGYPTDIKTIFVDGMFKYRSFAFMGDYANREEAAPVSVEKDGTKTGVIVLEGDAFNFQASYLLKSNFEFTGRLYHSLLSSDQCIRLGSIYFWN